MESWVDARLRDGMLGGLHSVGEYPVSMACEKARLQIRYVAKNMVLWKG